jgi:hypothetical protein
MKQLLIILALLFVFASCDTKLVENPKAETTLEMQQQPKDTMLVVMHTEEDNVLDRIEVYNFNHELIYEKHQHPTGLLLGMMFLFMFIGFSLSKAIFNKK